MGTDEETLEQIGHRLSIGCFSLFNWRLWQMTASYKGGFERRKISRNSTNLNRTPVQYCCKWRRTRQRWSHKANGSIRSAVGGLIRFAKSESPCRTIGPRAVAR